MKYQSSEYSGPICFEHNDPKSSHFEVGGKAWTSANATTENSKLVAI